MEKKVYNERAKQLLSQKRFDELKVISKQMLAHDPLYANALLHHGIGLFETGDPEGFEWMKKAHAQDPENDYYLFVMAVSHTRDKKYTEALQYIKAALELDPENERYVCFTGEILTNSKQYKKAIPYFDDALQLDPQNADAFMNKAYCYTQLGEKQEAEKLIDEALAIDPEDDHLQYLAASAYYDLQQYKKSRALMKGYLVLDPRDEWARYTYLMAHHGWLSGKLFSPGSMKIIEKITLSVALLTACFQILFFAGIKLPPVIPLVSAYLAQFFILYILVRGFLTLFLVWRLNPQQRSDMLNPKHTGTILMYTGTITTMAAYLTDLVLRLPLTHIICFAVLHVFVFSLVIIYHKTLSRKKQWMFAAYFLLFSGSLYFLKYLHPIQFTALLAPATALVMVTNRIFLMNLAKSVLGFKEREEDAYSF